jgi:hypothetical protein
MIRTKDAAGQTKAQPRTKRRRTSKAVVLTEPAPAPQSLPVLIERVAASVSSVDDLAKSSI